MLSGLGGSNPSLSAAFRMNEGEYVKPGFPADAFAGTADFYVRHRVPYPERLLKDLMARACVGGGGRLLDLACGPGRLTLALAGKLQHPQRKGTLAEDCRRGRPKVD